MHDQEYFIILRTIRRYKSVFTHDCCNTRLFSKRLKENCKIVEIARENRKTLSWKF